MTDDGTLRVEAAGMEERVGVSLDASSGIPDASGRPLPPPSSIKGVRSDAWGAVGLNDDWSGAVFRYAAEPPHPRDRECTPHAEPHSRDVPAESVEEMYNPRLLRSVVARERAGKLFLIYDDRIEVRRAVGDGLLQTVVYTEEMRGLWQRQRVVVSEDGTMLEIDAIPTTGTMLDYEDEGEEPVRRDLFVVDLDEQQGERVVPKPLCPGRHFLKFHREPMVGGRLLPAQWFEAGRKLHGVLALRGPRFGESLVPIAPLRWTVYFVRHPFDPRDTVVWCWNMHQLWEVSREAKATLLYEESEEYRPCIESIHGEGLVAIAGMRRTHILCPALRRECDAPAAGRPMWKGDVLVNHGHHTDIEVFDAGEWVRAVREQRERVHAAEVGVGRNVGDAAVAAAVAAMLVDFEARRAAGGGGGRDVPVSLPPKRARKE
jgi:hypothetical protein